MEESAVLDVTVQAVQRGPDGFAYFLERHKETSVLTNLANGKTVTFVRRTLTAKDLKTTDNGDGTLTTVFLLTGNDVFYGADGKAIARDPGQARIELVIDHGGTPTDFSDDRLISRETRQGIDGPD